VGAPDPKGGSSNTTVTTHSMGVANNSQGPSKTVASKKTSKKEKEHYVPKKSIITDSSGDGDTRELINIEKRKLELLEEQLAVNKKCLSAEEHMCKQVDKIYGLMSQWPANPLTANRGQLPSFDGTPNNPTPQYTPSQQMYNNDFVHSSGYAYMNM
jgi:hypothetical protein